MVTIFLIIRQKKLAKVRSCYSVPVKTCSSIETMQKFAFTIKVWYCFPIQIVFSTLNLAWKKKLWILIWFRFIGTIKRLVMKENKTKESIHAPCHHMTSLLLTYHGLKQVSNKRNCMNRDGRKIHPKVWKQAKNLHALNIFSSTSVC